MAKTKNKWLNRDVADPEHIGAATLPFDASMTIKEVIDFLIQGRYAFSQEVPDAEDLGAPSCQFYFYNGVLRIMCKNSYGTVSDHELCTTVEPVEVITGNTVVLSAKILLADTTSNNINITLPISTAPLNGKISIKKISAANSVNITTSGSDTIDGSTSITLTSNNESCSLVQGPNGYFTI